MTLFKSDIKISILLFLPRHSSVITSSVITSSVITNSVINKHLVIKNRFFCQVGHFSVQINPVITNPGCNEHKWPVPSCSLEPSLIVHSLVYKIETVLLFY